MVSNMVRIMYVKSLSTLAMSPPKRYAIAQFPATINNDIIRNLLVCDFELICKQSTPFGFMPCYCF